MFLSISKRVKIVVLSVILGMIAGVLDSAIDSVFFYDSGLFEEIFHPSNFEIYIRSFLLIIFLLFGIVTSMRLELRKTRTIHEKTLGELKSAQREIDLLERYLPICASCKKIRDEKGEWHQLEQYITDHSGVHFSHGLCPRCSQKAAEEMEASGQE